MVKYKVKLNFFINRFIDRIAGVVMERILFVATVESHILNFHIPFIRYFQEKGYEVHVATNLSDRKKELSETGVVCHDIPFSKSIMSVQNISAIWQLRKVIKENNFKLIHVHTPIAAFLTRLINSMTVKVPLLYTAHGFHFYKGAPKLNWVIYYTMEKLAARWTDGIITINKEDFNYAKNFKLKRENSVFLVNGVGLNTSLYRICDTDYLKSYRKALGYTERDIIITAIAEINKNKNQKQIIDALDALKTDRNIYFLLVGEGSAIEWLRSYVKYKKLDDKVVFLGFRKDVSELINISDIIALTSYREGLPRCLMEAMAAGKPVIATDVRGNRDLVINESNGLLVSVNDIRATLNALKRLIDDKELRLKLGQNGYNMVKSYDLSSIITEMDYIYNLYL